MFLLFNSPSGSLLETPEAGYRQRGDETSDIAVTDSFLLDTVKTPRPIIGAALASKTLAFELKKTKRNNFIGITVGRGLDNDVCLNDAKLSKFHGWFFCSFNGEAEQWFYTDVGSKNGTSINGVVCEPRKEYRIQTGDELAFGSNVAVFVSDDLE